ncbi:ABC transporter ATP-binding protein [Lachnoclostridium sp. An169]|uniref:ABC transporter ATP-binding protein n=1 Tax=Lachnoclostridium sp. An169 TaxID=1965569 RepID=UPI000B36D8FB|nr:ABC transporter ATP-binding protein [Lachnoclostridium sp. An169]OUP84327.1 ABC transporter ATP-binding protein [Lachnoclostridium sp. An169]
MNLTLSDLTKYYGDKAAADHISLKLTPGITGLLGPNGAGKTTLIRMLCDLLRPDRGRILLDGEEIHLMGERYRDLLGYVPQKIGFYPWFTAEKYLTYLAVLKGLDKKQAAGRIDELLDRVGLSPERKKKLGAFSGGMLQRIGIAQALLNDPKILILDEPTAGLDPRERIRFRSLIAGFARDRLVLLSTHIVSDVEHIATQVLLMKNGKILAQETIEELCRRFSGQVFTLNVPAGQAEAYQQLYLVTNVQPAGNQVKLRIVCPDEPEGGAVPAAPTLEDAYLALCGGESPGSRS